MLGPMIATSRRSKLEKAEMNPTTANPRLGGAHLELEGTVGPADECGRHAAEKDMEDEIDEKHDSDIEKYVPGEEFLDDETEADRSRYPGDRCKGENQTKDEERQRVVRYDECNGGLDHQRMPPVAARIARLRSFGQDPSERNRTIGAENPMLREEGYGADVHLTTSLLWMYI